MKKTDDVVEERRNLQRRKKRRAAGKFVLLYPFLGAKAKSKKQKARLMRWMTVFHILLNSCSES
jgi:hypothetical protein